MNQVVDLESLRVHQDRDADGLLNDDSVQQLIAANNSSRFASLIPADQFHGLELACGALIPLLPTITAPEQKIPSPSLRP